VRDLGAAIDAADAVLIATREYNARFPGVLTNGLHWASRPHATNVLRGKPVALVGASTGIFGAVWAQAEARKVLGTIGARVLDRELPVFEAPPSGSAPTGASPIATWRSSSARSRPSWWRQRRPGWPLRGRASPPEPRSGSGPAGGSSPPAGCSTRRSGAR
jgi:hypothetical protein